jgi:hypothetical protein
VLDFILIAGVLAVILWTPFFVGSGIVKVAPFTGYLKPVLGLLVALFGAVLSSISSEMHPTCLQNGMSLFLCYLPTVTCLKLSKQ